MKTIIVYDGKVFEDLDAVLRESVQYRGACGSRDIQAMRVYMVSSSSRLPRWAPENLPTSGIKTTSAE